MRAEILELYLNKTHIGQMHPYKNAGSVAFEYDPDYSLDQTPLSLSMLDHTVVYRSPFRKFLLNLRPDDSDKLAQLARSHEFSADNLFKYFSILGLDCAGALQFVLPGEAAKIQSREERLEPISDEEIEKRLYDVRTNPKDPGIRSGEHISLAGFQSKFALHRQDGHWYKALGGIPTTHILKPGIQIFPHQALNEFLCMKIAERLGLNAAEVNYQHFGEETAIIVTRYDRATGGNGNVYRLHQEDICQSLSVLPDQKYESEKGPTAADIVGLLDKHSLNVDRESNIKDFISGLFFQYFMGAPDGHAKNYSVLLDGQRVRLAPLYDISSTFDIDNKTVTGGVFRLAQNIGGCKDFGDLHYSNIIKFAKRADVDADFVLEIAKRIATDIPDATGETIEKYTQVDGVQYFREPFQRWSTKLSKMFLEDISKNRAGVYSDEHDDRNVTHNPELSFDTVSKSK
ncbi:MAG: HipA domain-containing protein [Clostridiales Family XIII bacterium]|jgi:serine/threonine-protein kinase HipA|nr:HipA domain-containing protein [Clostridiales Family XIII bacterium]